MTTSRSESRRAKPSFETLDRRDVPATFATPFFGNFGNVPVFPGPGNSFGVFHLTGGGTVLLRGPARFFGARPFATFVNDTLGHASTIPTSNPFFAGPGANHGIVTLPGGSQAILRTITTARPPFTAFTGGGDTTQLPGPPIFAGPGANHGLFTLPGGGMVLLR
jgi:hypothetical protein